MTPSGSFELYAKIAGRRIRERFRDASTGEARRAELMQGMQRAQDRAQSLRLTWLTEGQLREAEAATMRAGGRSLLECVEASDRVMVTGEPVGLEEAWREWEADQRKRKRFARTVQNNHHRARAFIRFAGERGEVTVGDVKPETVEAFVYRGERADFTRANDAAVIAAWCRFWVKRRWVKESPFEVEMRDLKERARAGDLPRILTPGQARELMRAAMALKTQGMAAYVALTTWCFLRHAEALRVTAADLRLDGARPVVEVRPRKRGTASYRAVNVPVCVLPILRAARAEAVAKGEGSPVAHWGRVRWDTVRAAAGLIERGPLRNKKRGVLPGGVWQENILRHTGISYLFQQTGDIGEVTRQAGNSSDTAFRHYVQLPAEGAAAQFYAAF